MPIIETRSGRKYSYSKLDNKIRFIRDLSYIEPNPIVKYSRMNEFKSSSITKFTIEMTQRCNMRCSYCCYSGLYKDRHIHNNSDISTDTLNYTLDFIERICDSHKEPFTICFYGGEALLAFKLIQYVVSKMRGKYKDRVDFSLTTNGLMLNRQTIDWICSIQKFSINVSIDGNQEMHNLHRKNINGNGTFSQIYKNLEYFKKTYPEEYKVRLQILSTVENWKAVKNISEFWEKDLFFNDKRPVRVSHLIPNFDDCSRVYDTKVTKDDFFRYAFDEFKKGHSNIAVDSLKKLINIIEARVFYEIPEKQPIETCLQDMYTCFINIHGDIYACEKFCEEHKLGNVRTGIDDTALSNLYHSFVDRKNRFCGNCWASRLCRVCLTGMNFKNEEIPALCTMEKDTLELALKYYCEMQEFISVNRIP